MSGIFGVLYLDGRQVEPEVLRRMSDTLAHRGPDGENSWHRGSVGLGHRMFHTTPESLRERPPTVARGGDLVLTADARLDNRKELIAALEARARRPEDVTDLDLLLGAYERWGGRCGERLLGDFAFALWDGSRGSLVCARDHFGVRPLYYFHAPGRIFAFASEIKALLTLEEVPDEIDELEVARHLIAPVGEDLAATYYRHVRRVLPGHMLAVTHRGLEENRYWQLDGSRELTLSSDEEYAEAFRDVFVEAVRCRLRSTTPVASMLSGGLDSSAVTCVAARLLRDSGGEKLHTLSAIYPRVPASDERSFIREVLERHEVEAGFFEADAVSPIAEIDRMNWHGDGANFGGNLYLQWKLYGLAARAGCRVVLDGFDGDTTVSHGTGYLQELALDGRWLKLLWTAVPHARRLGESPAAVYWAWVRRFGLRPALQHTAIEALVRRIRRRGRKPGRNGARPAWQLAISADFARRLSDRIVAFPEPARTEREDHCRLLMRQILLHGINWTEACGAGAGVDVRFPFFDVRLVELCVSFPPDQKLRRGWSRLVMRRALEGILPRKIQWRPAKTSVAPGFRFALHSHGRERIDALVEHSRPSVERFVDRDKFRGLRGRFMAGHASTAEELAFWRALSLALWLTPYGTGRFTEGRGAAQSLIGVTPRPSNYEEAPCEQETWKEALPSAEGHAIWKCARAHSELRPSEC